MIKYFQGNGGVILTVIVCVSDSGGMMFNKRRQSRDARVISDIVELVASQTLFVSDYSAPLFADSEVSIIAVSSPLEAAKPGDAVFIEDRALSPYASKISELIIYKWNREYPSDFHLDINPEGCGMALVSSLDFAGKSHEKVTRLVFKRSQNI